LEIRLKLNGKANGTQPKSCGMKNVAILSTTITSIAVGMSMSGKIVYDD
jgi:hypothetical protein